MVFVVVLISFSAIHSHWLCILHATFRVHTRCTALLPCSLSNVKLALALVCVFVALYVCVSVSDAPTLSRLLESSTPAQQPVSADPPKPPTVVPPALDHLSVPKTGLWSLWFPLFNTLSVGWSVCFCSGSQFPVCVMWCSSYHPHPVTNLSDCIDSTGVFWLYSRITRNKANLF